VVRAPREDASLTSPPEEAAQRDLAQVPGGADVVLSTAFARGAQLGLGDLLKQSPGVFIAPQNGGEDMRISIRGSGIQSDGVIGVQFLLDGSPYNQGDGEALLEDFDLSAIRYGEVYRGANALRYGAAGLGGAVNLVPATGRDAGRFGATARFGSFGYLSQELHSGGVSGPRDYFVSASNYGQTGFRRHSREQDQKLFCDLGWRPNPDRENRLYLTFGHLDRQQPSVLTKDQLRSDPTQTDGPSQEQDFHLGWWGLRLADKLSVWTEQGRLDASLYWTYRNLEQKQFFADDFRQGIDAFASNNVGWQLFYEEERELFGAANSWTAGLSPGFEYEPSRSYANIGGSRGDLIAASNNISVNVPAFFEDRYRLSKALSLVMGFQYSHNVRDFRDRFHDPNLGDQSKTVQYDGFNPKLGLVYDLAPASQVFANLSRSYQPPSFDDMTSVKEGTNGGLVFNPLSVQTASTAEAGTRGRRGPLRWEVSLYRSWLRHELLELNDALGNPLGTVNADRTVHQGVEAGFAVALGDRLSLEQTYSLSDFYFPGDPTYGHDRIAGVPEHLYRAELDYEHPKGFYAGPELEWSISRYPVDHANTLFADPYALLGFKCGYRTKRGLSGFFEARNLSDKVYAATVAPIADARTEDPAAVFKPGNGRGFYGGVSWVW